MSRRSAALLVIGLFPLLVIGNPSSSAVARAVTSPSHDFTISSEYRTNPQAVTPPSHDFTISSEYRTNPQRTVDTLSLIGWTYTRLSSLPSNSTTTTASNPCNSTNNTSCAPASGSSSSLASEHLRVNSTTGYISTAHSISFLSSRSDLGIVPSSLATPLESLTLHNTTLAVTPGSSSSPPYRNSTSSSDTVTRTATTASAPRLTTQSGSYPGVPNTSTNMISTTTALLATTNVATAAPDKSLGQRRVSADGKTFMAFWVAFSVILIHGVGATVPWLVY